MPLQPRPLPSPHRSAPTKALGRATGKWIGILVLLLSFTMPNPWSPSDWLGAEAHASRFRRARKLFYRANRAAKRRSYNRAINLYKRIVRTLRRNTRRDRRGRWEAILRIAVIHARRKEWRKARQRFEGLWRTCPPPQRRYQRRLQQQFNALKRNLSAEIVLFVRPANSKVLLRFQNQLRAPHRTSPFSDARQYWFDVPEGSFQLKVLRLGYAARTMTITTILPRTTQVTITLRPLRGIAYPQAFYRSALSLHQQNKRADAMTRLLQAKQHLTPGLRATPAGKQLAVGISLRQAEWLVGLNKYSAARQQFSQLWQRYPGRRPRLEQTMCRLHRQTRWRPPTLTPKLPCYTPQASTTRAPFNPNFPSPITWALLGTAGVGFIAGAAIFFGLTEPTRLERDKDNPPHPRDKRNELADAYDTYFTITWVALGIGIAAAVGAGIVYLLYDRKRRPGATALRTQTPQTRALGQTLLHLE